VHSATGAAQAERAGADFVLLGTIFASASHPERTPGGLALVREARTACRLPLIAIGGIDAGNAAGVLAAGADGVAVIRAILDAPDVGAAAAELKQTLQQAWQEVQACASS
jgi:thiamine-phosphate pyrophosphorylase